MLTLLIILLITPTLPSSNITMLTILKIILLLNYCLIIQCILARMFCITRRDEHGIHKPAHGRLEDSLFCISCSLENNAFSVLPVIKVTSLPYGTSIRDSFCLGTFAHGFIMLPPRSLASSRARLLVGN